MSDDQFTKLSKQIDTLSDSILRLYEHTERRFDEQDRKFDERFREFDERFREVDQKFDQLYGLADTIIKNQETDQQERLAINHQLNRHEAWHHQVANHLELHLDYKAGS